MKFAVLPVACLLLASPTLAAPKVTEIRLKDVPGYGIMPLKVNELVFRADGNFYWLEGNTDKSVHHRYDLSQSDFQKLADTLQEQGFFDLEARYPTNIAIADAAKVVVSATRDGETKMVTDSPRIGSRPPELSKLQTTLRDFASARTGSGEYK